MRVKVTTTALAVGAVNLAGVGFALWVVYKIGEAIDSIDWSGHQNADYMLISCAGRAPKGWGQ